MPLESSLSVVFLFFGLFLTSAKNINKECNASKCSSGSRSNAHCTASGLSGSGTSVINLNKLTTLILDKY